MRVVRATTLAVVTLALAAAAHVLGGGELPSPGFLAGVLLPLSLGSSLLTRLRLGPLAVLAGLAPAELGLHLLFSAAAPGGSVASVVPAHGHGAGVVGMPPSGLPAGDLLAGSPAVAGHSSPAMIAAHALATVVTALALSHGERVLWILWESLRPVGLPRPVPLVPVASWAPVPTTAWVPTSVTGRCAEPRGPPVSGSGTPQPGFARREWAC